jgi:hypothetical protein
VARELAAGGVAGAVIDISALLDVWARLKVGGSVGVGKVGNEGQGAWGRAGGGGVWRIGAKGIEAQEPRRDLCTTPTPRKPPSRSPRQAPFWKLKPGRQSTRTVNVTGSPTLPAGSDGRHVTAVTP